MKVANEHLKNTFYLIFAYFLSVIQQIFGQEQKYSRVSIGGNKGT
jgi:hypothetical protein